ncbi:MAG TPA: choice-of-anchor Q domain-containing protein [Pyrinomonadaceae bacterium]|nr:choice-of-anchor Q domain-containing protein [Pyrinomonadaceae bacterium]
MFHQSLTHHAFTSKFVRASFTALAFFILTLAAQPVGAATVTVTSTADSGAGSLRQAVADANGTPVADTIDFNVPLTDPNCDSSGVCTVTLTGGVIIIQAAGGSLTIANQTGAGKLLISGNNASRIFESGQGANLTLDGLTVTGGASGGYTGGNGFGVVTNYRGTLTIMNSVFTQNTGEFVILTNAFGTGGILNVINTTVSNNAGVGIIVSNGATDGGTLNIVNSTISSNNGAGRRTGGIFFSAEQLTMSNSTISGNSGSNGGGIFATQIGLQQRPIVLTNCTVTANTSTFGGGGIEVHRATLNLRNTIVAGNTYAGSASDVRFWNASGASLGNNLIGTSTNFEFGNGQWLASDMLNQDARLAPLGNYGGATQTHALLPDSPAINRGDNTNAPATDQRGFARVVGGIIDIGAFEFAPAKSRKRVRFF